MKFKITLFAIIAFALAILVGASPVEKTTLTKANEAFVRVAKIAQDTAPIRMTTESTEKLSRQRVVANGSPTPSAPETNMWFQGVDDDNNVRIGLDVVTEFKPVNPLRIFVNGYRTRNDGVFQTTVEKTPASPYDLIGRGAAEIHGLQVVLPGKLGLYQIEGQIDWHAQYYFSSVLRHTIDHLGAIAQMCVSAEGSVKMMFVFNTFDKKFPSNVSITMNDVQIKPIGFVEIRKEGFFSFVTMNLSNADYIRLWEDFDRYGAATFILRGDNGVIISWQDYLPPLEHIGSCEGVPCFNAATGMPCN